ncbi:MAG: hypothetical protein ABJB40_09240 [Acidobacteriota bacterium]
MKLSGSKITKFAASLFCVLVFTIGVKAQSTDQNFPTPITASEISGMIKARDVGDSRLTSYFYAFDGDQGDIFINVATKNFSGDIDVFIADGLRPLTKMVIYADTDITETGRLIYLRKGERLMMRIEGRSPNDDAATFHIKFAGSFIALAPEKKDLTPKVDKTETDTSSRVTVNSVGTIVSTRPKKQPSKVVEKPKSDISRSEPPKKIDFPKGVPVKIEEEPPASKPADETKVVDDKVKPQEDTIPTKAADEAKPETVYENKTAKVTIDPVTLPKATPESADTPRVKSTPRRATRRTRVAPQPPAEAIEKKADPLAAIRLVIEMKDGKVIWSAMNEVLRFSVDRGVLTVIGKDGHISRYSILDVAKVTIQ